MYSLARALPLRRFLLTQAPALLASFVVAEASFHFHSFTLEFLAFLATWTAFDFVLSRTMRSGERAAERRDL